MHAKLRRTFGFGVAAAATFGLAVGGAYAETSLHPSAPAIAAPAPSPASPSAPDPAFEASKRAFEALPEDQRKAVQDALMWTGLYHGALDGAFGKGTREALIAFETREKINADAIVDQGEFARLAAAAKKAKEAVRFSTVTDDLTGVRFGLPLKLLTRRSVSRGGTRFASVDDGTVVETQVMREGDIDIAKLFERLKADGPDRKVTYKASRADWFVVSGEAGDKRFYTRIAQGTGPKGAELRGYTLTYPASAPDFERISIAIANSFEPFPGAPAVAEKPNPVEPVLPAPAPPQARFSATGLIVAPGRMVSVLPEACADPSIGKQKLKTLTSDPSSGLTLFDLANARGAGFALADKGPESGAPLVVVGYAASKDAAALGVAAGQVLLRPAVESKPATLRALAPLQENAGGNVVFDRNGQLLGLIGRPPQARRLVAGIVPEASYPVISAGDLARFLQGAGVAPAAVPGAERPLTAGDIVAANKGALVAITCVR